MYNTCAIHVHIHIQYIFSTYSVHIQYISINAQPVNVLDHLQHNTCTCTVHTNKDKIQCILLLEHAAKINHLPRSILFLQFVPFREVSHITCTVNYIMYMYRYMHYINVYVHEQYITAASSIQVLLHALLGIAHYTYNVSWFYAHYTCTCTTCIAKHQTTPIFQHVQAYIYMDVYIYM